MSVEQLRRRVEPVLLIHLRYFDLLSLLVSSFNLLQSSSPAMSSPPADPLEVRQQIVQP